MTDVLQAANDGPFCQGNMMHTVHVQGGMMGGGMIMYMEGFRWSLAGNQPCLNLYFSSWTLNTRLKFIAGMMGIFVLAILVEGIAKMRQRVVRSAKANAAAWSSSRLRVTITSLHGFQALFGYILMLATMTFSLELLLATVLGLSTGYFVFFRPEDALMYEEQHVTTNPCCAFMENEAQEDQVEDTGLPTEGYSLIDPLLPLNSSTEGR